MTTVDAQQNFTAGPVGTAPTHQFLTIGLSPALTELAVWAADLGHTDGLLLLIDVCHANKHPEFLGTAFRALLNPIATRRLTDWATEFPSFEDLSGLMEAVGSSPDVLVRHPPMPESTSVSKQLAGGLLGALPVVALLARPIPLRDRREDTWISTLRIWGFMQVAATLAAGGHPSRYLINSIEKLRLAIDRDQEWLNLFRRLEGPSDSFQGLTHHLQFAAERLLISSHDPVVRPSHRTLLAELRNHCAGKVPADSLDDHTPSTSLFVRYRTSIDRPKPTGLDRFGQIRRDEANIEADEETEVGIFEVTDDSADEDVERFVVQPAAALGGNTIEQATAGLSVLLASVEDQQFLQFGWNRLTQNEWSQLFCALEGDWIRRDPMHRPLVVAVGLALLTGQSIDAVLRIKVSAEVGVNWAFDPLSHVLHRKPPRRYRGWRASGAALFWVHPLASEMRLTLPPTLAQEISELQASNPQAQLLEHLVGPSAPLKKQFRLLCEQTRGLERLSSGTLTRALEQAVFDATNDPAWAQLWASHERTGLPGACAYASFSSSQVGHVVQSIAPSTAAAFSNPPDEPGVWINALGSELQLVEARVREACHAAWLEVDRLAREPNRWLEHHNTMSAYLVVALLAATGARPVRSPFEALGHFDLDERFVYVDDKVSTPVHQGRLVPLIDLVVAAIRNVYLPHLRRLAQIISRVDAEFSAAIADLLEPQPIQRMPLFFLLRTDPQLDWAEVSEAAINALDLFAWPLPLRLFRHWLAAQLPNLGIDREVINGALGHGEQGTASYGPYSARVWAEDVVALRSAIEVLLNRLGLRAPTVAQWPLDQAPPPVRPNGLTALVPGRPFGVQGRTKARAQQDKQIVQTARADIDAHMARLGDRPLDGEVIERLEHLMLMRPDGLPQRSGSRRIEVLEEWLNDRWRQQGQTWTRRRRFLPLLDEASPFTPVCAGALQRLAQARPVLTRFFEVMQPSKVNFRHARFWLALALVVESRITNPRTIQCALLGEHLQVVVLKGLAYVEQRLDHRSAPRAPTQRYWISRQTAELLHISVSTDYNLDMSRADIPAQCTPLVAVFNEGHGKTIQTALDLIERIRETVEQANTMEMPGHLAGYFAGTIVTAALHHSEWARVEHGRALAVPSDSFMGPTAPPVFESVPENANADEEQAPDAEFDATGKLPIREEKRRSQLLSGTNKSTSAQAPSPQQSARAFFRGVRRLIRARIGQRSSPRRDLDVALGRLIEASTSTSRTCLLLGEWARSLIWRRTPRGPLALSSVERYLSALSPCFECAGDSHDLLLCDDEDIEAFYKSVLAARRLLRPNSRAGSTTVEADTKGYQTWQLALIALRDFHRFVSSEYGLEDPDWSEIDTGEDIVSISPGVITEQAYQSALQLLAPAAETASRDDLAPAFLLFLGMRFGLRSKEAMGLRRSDWVDPVDSQTVVVVLVRGHPSRRLKTPAGRRQVPLVFALSPLEKTIVERFLVLWQTTGAHRSAALFTLSNGNSPVSQAQAGHLRTTVIEAIKKASTCAHLTFHHARHSFANRVARLLLADGDDYWHFASESGEHKELSSHTRRLLLSSDKTSRRLWWSVARLLGHAHPVTTMHSYIHLLPDAAASRVRRAALGTVRVGSPNETALHLDLLPEASVPSASTATTPTALGSTAEGVLCFFNLLNSDWTSAQAARAAGLALDEAECWLQRLDVVDQILARRPKINPANEKSSRLLSNIRCPRWQELIALARGANIRYPAQVILPNEIQLLNEMVGPTRQILMYQPIHFMLANQMLRSWALSRDEIDVLTTQPPSPTLTELAIAHGFLINPTPDHVELIKHRRQIDSVSISLPDSTTQFRPVNRMAMIPRGGKDRQIRSSFELLLLFLLSISLTI